MINPITGLVAVALAIALVWQRHRNRKQVAKVEEELADMTAQSEGWHERYKLHLDLANIDDGHHDDEVAKLEKKLAVERELLALCRKKRMKMEGRLRQKGQRYQKLIGRLNVAMQDPQEEPTPEPHLTTEPGIEGLAERSTE